MHIHNVVGVCHRCAYWLAYGEDIEDTEPSVGAKLERNWGFAEQLIVSPWPKEFARIACDGCGAHDDGLRWPMTSLCNHPECKELTVIVGTEAPNGRDNV